MITNILKTPEEMEKAYRLRHDVFVDRLHWVPGNPERLETDRYDEHSVHVGVFQDSALIGYCRFTPYGKPWMLTGEFDWYKGPIDNDSVELSRLALDTSAPHQRMILARVFHEASQHIASAWTYAETTHRRVPVYRRMGLVFEELDRHLYDEWAVVIKIDMKGTPWHAIKERYERCITAYI
jgi:N-acyl-L-homoserine lactone synthetase